MPESWIAWTALGGLAYVWMGVGRVAEDFSARPISRPGYARAGGPHILLVVLYQPIAALLFFSVGGPGRVLKTLVATAVHFGLTLLAFWLLSFVIGNEGIRLAILAGLLLLAAVPFLIPVRNSR